MVNKVSIEKKKERKRKKKLRNCSHLNEPGRAGTFFSDAAPPLG